MLDTDVLSICFIEPSKSTSRLTVTLTKWKYFFSHIIYQRKSN